MVSVDRPSRETIPLNSASFDTPMYATHNDLRARSFHQNNFSQYFTLALICAIFLLYFQNRLTLVPYLMTLYGVAYYQMLPKYPRFIWALYDLNEFFGIFLKVNLLKTTIWVNTVFCVASVRIIWLIWQKLLWKFAKLRGWYVKKCCT
jgi:hypothetical protein